MATGETRALITGAAGFAGRHLIAELEQNTNWTIIGVTRRQASSAGRVRIIACDLQDRQLLERTVAHYRPNAIFHLAAQSYVPKAMASPADTLVNNVVSQVNLLEACRSAEIDPRILVVGSSEVYGFVTPEEMPVTEKQPFRPGNPYAVSKVTQDMLGYQYFKSYGMHIVRVRPFNHFGPGQSDRFVVSSFARQVSEAEAGLIEPTVLTGDLTSRRDFLDVRDVVRAYRMALELGEAGEVYNIASGSAPRVGDLLDALVNLANARITVRQDPSRMRPSDVPVIVGDASRFIRQTGWSPEIPIEISLRDTLDYWRDEVRRRRSDPGEAF